MSEKTDDPGWYPDPFGEDDLRRWDGDVWTAQTAEEEDPAVSSRVPYIRHAGDLIAIVLSVLIVGFVAYVFLAGAALALAMMPPEDWTPIHGWFLAGWVVATLLATGGIYYWMFRTSHRPGKVLIAVVVGVFALFYILALGFGAKVATLVATGGIYYWMFRTPRRLEIERADNAVHE